MLNEAVLALKGEKPEQEEEETSIDLQVDAFIPATYIKSEFQKLDMYKRIAGIETEEERSDMEEELMDRFGDIPAAAQNLLQIAMLKALAHRAGIVQICQKPDGIRFYMQPTVQIAGEKVPGMIESYKGRLRYISGKEPHFLYTKKALVIAEASRGSAGAASMSKGKAKKKEAEKIFEATGEVIQSIQQLREQKGRVER
jgi:transcription-repair coupling factor (superfamily II helicase)